MAVCANKAKLKKNICTHAACLLMHTVSISRSNHTAMSRVSSCTQHVSEQEDMQHVSSHTQRNVYLKRKTCNVLLWAWASSAYLEAGPMAWRRISHRSVKASTMAGSTSG